MYFVIYRKHNLHNLHNGLLCDSVKYEKNGMDSANTYIFSAYIVVFKNKICFFRYLFYIMAITFYKIINIKK